MRKTQVQSIIQPVQVQNRSGGNPVRGNKHGAVDFLQIIQQLISTNAQDTAGASQDSCAPRAGKNGLFLCKTNPLGSNPAVQALTELLEGVTPQTPEIQQEQYTTFLLEDIPALHEGIYLDSLFASLFNTGNRGTEQLDANTGTTPGILHLAHAMNWILQRAALGTPGGNGWAAEPVNGMGTSQGQMQQVLQIMQNAGLNSSNSNLYQVLKYTPSNPAPQPGEMATGHANSATTALSSRQASTDPVQQNSTNASSEESITSHRLYAVLRGWLENKSGDMEGVSPRQQGAGLSAAMASRNPENAANPLQGGFWHRTAGQVINTAEYEFNPSSPANAAAKQVTANNAQQAETAHFTLNTVDSILSQAGPARGETAPVVRTEQPLFLQLAEAIKGQVVKDSQGQTHLRLQLHPESLGEVVVKIVYKDGNLATHFHAATEGARQAIESSFSQLREALAAHQLNLQQSTVSTGSDHNSWAQEWSGERHYPKPFGQQQGNQNNKQGEPPLPETTSESQQPLYSLNHFV